jgi:hypothetical protein
MCTGNYNDDYDNNYNNLIKELNIVTFDDMFCSEESVAMYISAAILKS